MISINGLTVSFGGFNLFDSISFVINKRDRIALVGKNGAGKSTMLKILASLQLPTSGNIVVPKECTIGYLPQVMVPADTRTVLEETKQAFEYLELQHKQLAAMQQELVDRTDYESRDYQNLIDRMTLLTEHLHSSEGVSPVADMEKTLIGLGFNRSDFDRATSEFSGGWRMRIELAKLLLRKHDVLLLDEPTNHLDIESIQWLESFLSTYSGAVVLVSHDRAFIDNVTHRTIELSLGNITDYKVSYSQYVELRKERKEQQMRAYENQQKQIADTEEFIERFRYKSSKAVQVQSRIKQLDRVVRLEVDEEDTARLSLKFPPAPRSGSYPVIIENLEKSYADHTVISKVELTLERGEKVAFVGKNGQGKSTLVKCIMGEIPFEGDLTLGYNVKIGYFAQNQAQMLDGEKSVFQTIDDVAVGDIRTKVRDILGAFMFGGEASDKRVKVLSGGERSRLAMIKLLLEPVNLLILDEPTNHLDMRSKDVLKEAIKEFDGTVIIVSHDREFLDGLVEKVYEFGQQRVREHLGGIYDFIQKKKIHTLSELELTTTLTTDTIATPTTTPAIQQDPSGSKLTYEQRKDQARALKKAERELAQVEQQIATLEAELAELEQQMMTPEGAADRTLFEQHGKFKRDLEWIWLTWEECSQQVESLKSKG